MNILLKKVRNCKSCKSKYKVIRSIHGRFVKPPKIGTCFSILLPGMKFYYTGTVIELLPPDIFKTVNSIYKYQII